MKCLWNSNRWVRLMSDDGMNKEVGCEILTLLACLLQAYNLHKNPACLATFFNL